MKNNGNKITITVSIITAALILIALGFNFEFNRNTAMADTNDNICEYHGISVDLCTRCNPELITEFKNKGDWCEEHNLPESQCDICAGSHAHDHDDCTDEHDHEAEHEDESYHDHESSLHSPEIDIERTGEFSVYFRGAPKSMIFLSRVPLISPYGGVYYVEIRFDKN